MERNSPILGALTLKQRFSFRPNFSWSQNGTSVKIFGSGNLPFRQNKQIKFEN